MIGRGPHCIGPADTALRLQSDPAELSRVRRFAHAAATRFGMSRTDREDFMLAASEAVANAIEHGCPCCDGVIHVWAAEQGESLTLGVRNGGEFGFDAGTADTFAERGRGLPL